MHRHPIFPSQKIKLKLSIKYIYCNQEQSNLYIIALLQILV